MSLEIESLLFKQVKKPKHHFMTKVINVYDNRYRINVYIEIEHDNLTKRKIAASYFCHFFPGNLVIIDDHTGLFKREKYNKDLSSDIEAPQESGVLAEV